MASLLGNYFGNAALQDYFRSRNTWLALHFNDPGVTGDLSTEVNGGSYVRQPAQWTVPSAKTIATSNTIIFHDLPAFTLKYIAVWDAVSNGHLMLRFAVTPNQSIGASSLWRALPGDIAVTL